MSVPSQVPARSQLVTTAGRILAALLEEPTATIRDLARRCNRTERAVWERLQQLERAGLLRRRRLGRRSHYVVDASAVGRQLSEEAALLLSIAAHQQHTNGQPAPTAIAGLALTQQEA